jgi:hypothetical protein
VPLHESYSGPLLSASSWFLGFPPPPSGMAIFLELSRYPEPLGALRSTPKGHTVLALTLVRTLKPALGSGGVPGPTAMFKDRPK